MSLVKKFALLLLPALCLTVHAKSPMPKYEVLKIFEISGFGGQEYKNDDGFSKKFDPKTQSIEHCVTWANGDESCATTFIDGIKDMNGDKQPEILVIDEAHGTYHYGNTGTAFALLTKTKTGYRLIAESMGIPTFLKTKGRKGYPDIEVGGPGFCFVVLRYDGKTYKHHRDEYEGQPCQR